MTDLPNFDDVSRFRHLIAERLGLHLDESRLGNLAEVLRRRVEATGSDNAHYLDRLAEGAHPYRDLQLLSLDLTVTETFFYRNADQIEALISRILPERFAKLPGGCPLRILSAGCASGEEPYSLAIAAHEAFPDCVDSISIQAFDINPSMLERAERATYSSWSLREVPDVLRSRWFARERDAFAVDPRIRRAVAFHGRNLADNDPEFWRPNQFDVVFCRNVLMYFTVGQAQAALARIARSLVPDGYLFLGYAETLRGLSDDFHLCHADNSFYYRRKTDVSMAQKPWLRASAPPYIASPMPLNTGGTNWVDIIQRSATRIQELVQTVPTAPSDPGETLAAPDLSRVLEHLHYEQFDKALERITCLPPLQAKDPDVLLLKAVSLAHSDALDEAQAVCEELLDRQSSNAGAHYVLALCREGMGDLSGAVEHNQEAIRVDSNFAMPHLHLGLIAKRRGDMATAERELRRAILLLQSEDSARLLLFGGGFRREALISLCQAECKAVAVMLMNQDRPC